MSKFIRFIKNWTLPLSMGIGAVAYLVFYYVEALEGLSQRLAPVFDSILPLFMFLILYVTFCKVDFKKLAQQKKVDNQTIVFNNLVTNLYEYQHAWETPMEHSWHNRFLK